MYFQSPPHINIGNDRGAGKRKKGNDDGSENNRPRRNVKGPLETYPCCDCSKWGEVLAFAAERWMPLRCRAASMFGKLSRRMPTRMSEPTFYFSTYPAGCPRNGAFDRNDGTDFYVQTDQPSALVPGVGPSGRGSPYRRFGRLLRCGGIRPGMC